MESVPKREIQVNMTNTSKCLTLCFLPLLCIAAIGQVKLTREVAKHKIDTLLAHGIVPGYKLVDDCDSCLSDLSFAIGQVIPTHEPSLEDGLAKLGYIKIQGSGPIEWAQGQILKTTLVTLTEKVGKIVGETQGDKNGMFYQSGFHCFTSTRDSQTICNVPLGL